MKMKHILLSSNGLQESGWFLVNLYGDQRGWRNRNLKQTLGGASMSTGGPGLILESSSYCPLSHSHL
jgi:hypothetical protein